MLLQLSVVSLFIYVILRLEEVVISSRYRASSDSLTTFPVGSCEDFHGDMDFIRTFWQRKKVEGGVFIETQARDFGAAFLTCPAFKGGKETHVSGIVQPISNLVGV